jgi:hypothetical protein
LPAPEPHAASIATVFAAPSPTFAPVALVGTELTLHHIKSGSLAPPFQVFGAISYVLPPDIEKISPPPGPMVPKA